MRAKLSGGVDIIVTRIVYSRGRHYVLVTHSTDPVGFNKQLQMILFGIPLIGMTPYPSSRNEITSEGKSASSMSRLQQPSGFLSSYIQQNENGNDPLQSSKSTIGHPHLAKFHKHAASK